MAEAMTIHIYNTAARAKQRFEPLDPDGTGPESRGVGMYVCGPTVYDRIHIGNARPLVVFDVFYRLLKAEYPKVTYVRNITDVDDKINARAAERGVSIRQLTEQTVERFHEDAAALGCLEPDVEPRATDHIDGMIAMIARLIARGHAYEAEGHVLFDVPSWPDYGKFSGRDREEQVAGARVEVAPYKRDPADFVLWKPSGDGEPGWDSPWGYGRPGWHIECSAMSARYLGDSFDIHGGGQDLIFPHHQNEVAQSCCANPDAAFARYWMHNGYLMSEGEKMSKSLGNFYTVAELLEEFPGEALRLVLLKTHYRQPLDFSKEKCREAKAELDGYYRLLREFDRKKGEIPDSDQLERDFDQTPYLPGESNQLRDDLNTPAYLAALSDTRDRASNALTRNDLRDFGLAVLDLKNKASLVGLLQQDPEAWFHEAGGTGAKGPGAEEIETLIEQRKQARTNRDFATADRIRDDLKAGGVVLEDKPGGVTEWRRE